MTPLDSLGSKIRQARREAGFKNSETLAVQLGVGARTMQRWEQGAGQPSIERLIQIAEATAKPLAFFFATDEVAA